MHSRVVILSLLALLYCGPSFAQQGLLWRISGHGLAKPSYLFGTIDFICPGDYVWTAGDEECLARTNKVCFTLDLSDPTLKKRAAEAMMISNGKKLQDYFAAGDYMTVKHYAASKMGLNLDSYQSFVPLAIQPAIIKKLLGCADPKSYDKQVLAIARTKGKAVAGLETLDEAMQDIDATNFNEKIAVVLTEMANGSNYYNDYRASIMNAYKKQDLAQVNSIFKTAKGFSPQDFKVLADETSKRWASRMPALMQHASVFFSLNALNLGGVALRIKIINFR